MPDHIPPAEWQERRLIDLAHYLNGYAFKPADWSLDGTRIIRIEQLNNPEGHYDHFDGWFPAANAIDDGDLIFSWSATLKVAIWRHGRGVLNQHLFKVVPKEGFDKRFIFYILDLSMDALGGGSHGSTMKHIKRGELERYTIRAPQFPEQQRIAEVLSTVDEAIEHTEALVAKTQQIKAGLMHDLFTRGVTPDGQLRPPREEAPKLYKDSPLGWIPKEWDLDHLGNLTSRIVDGVHHTPAYVEHGVPFVTVKNLTLSRSIDFTDLNYITPVDHREFLRRADPKPGDVLVTKDGTLGVSRIVEPWHPEFSIFVSVALLRPIPARLRAWTLHLFFDSGAYERQLGRLSAGTGLKHIHLEHFRKFAIPLPDAEEQDRIAQIAQSLEERLSAEEVRHAKLCQLKLGLMHDLLSGRVRLPVADAQKVAANV